tara:strand:+ start:1029 stop:1220 length:192 start_codon:yes stop_codon:yes gene_type:complete
MTDVKNYKVSFEPHDTPRYVYWVDASDEQEAESLGRDEFQMDIGYDKAKDFTLVGVEEADDDD